MAWGPCGGSAPEGVPSGGQNRRGAESSHSWQKPRPRPSGDKACVWLPRWHCQALGHPGQKSEAPPSPPCPWPGCLQVLACCSAPASASSWLTPPPHQGHRPLGSRALSLLSMHGPHAISQLYPRPDRMRNWGPSNHPGARVPAPRTVEGPKSQAWHTPPPEDRVSPTQRLVFIALPLAHCPGGGAAGKGGSLGGSGGGKRVRP